MSEKMPEISVIMSTYNRKEFLSASIEGILSQTFDAFEFILVNNGSADGSNVICEGYAEKDSRIRLINIEQNHGAPAGRNAGLDNASCEYITIVDDDDYCEPQMLEFLWTLAKKHNADISMCGSWNDYGSRREPYFIFDELLILDKVRGLDELLKREKYNVAPPTKLFRKSLFDNIRFIENVLVDDIHVLYKVFANADIVAAQGVPLYSFRKHDGNMTNYIQTNKLSPELLWEYLSAFRERREYLSVKVPEITARARYSEWSYMISMCEKIKLYNCNDCMQLYNFMVKSINENIDEFLSSHFITEREKSLLEKYVF
jgi:glycosyltransferase involved in cell wall biosynthesis